MDCLMREQISTAVNTDETGIPENDRPNQSNNSAASPAKTDAAATPSSREFSSFSSPRFFFYKKNNFFLSPFQPQQL